MGEKRLRTYQGGGKQPGFGVRNTAHRELQSHFCKGHAACPCQRPFRLLHRLSMAQGSAVLRQQQLMADNQRPAHLLQKTQSVSLLSADPICSKRCSQASGRWWNQCGAIAQELFSPAAMKCRAVPQHSKTQQHAAVFVLPASENVKLM